MRRFQQRALWVFVLLALGLSWLGSRLTKIQVIEGARFAAQAVAQRQHGLAIDAGSGRILDRQGQPLAHREAQLAIGLLPALIKEEQLHVATQLAPLLGQPISSLLEKIKAGRPFWAAVGVDVETAKAAAALPGVHVAVLFQSQGGLASHLTGTPKIRLGLHGQYATLLGAMGPTQVAATLDGRGVGLAGLGVRVVPSPQAGVDLVTTIDARVQAEVERVLDGQPGLRAAVVVTNPQTGEVLALASRPTFDPMTGEGDQQNRALLAYPPGSVFKPLVAAVALEAGVVTPFEEFHCKGTYDLGDYQPGESGDPHGDLNLSEAIARSCNVTFMELGVERLGAQALVEGVRPFGLGQPVLGLPGEAAGNLEEPAYTGDLAMLSFGQGSLTVTPLQMAQAYGAIANDGLLRPLTLVTQAVRDGAPLWTIGLPPGRRVLARETAHDLRAALRLATSVGTGSAADLPGIGSGGKTGTAEWGGTPHAWFAGFFPEAKPKYVIVVFVEEGESGGGVAAPLFRELALAIAE